MTGFYNITTAIKDQLLTDPFCNTVTIGDIFEVDLKKQTIFPLSHIIVNNATLENNIWRFNMTVIAMDIVDKSNDAITDAFLGNDNEHDVLNTQLAVLNRLLEVLRRGSLYSEYYQLDGNPSLEPFTERFENFLAGWAATFDVLIPNDMTACDGLVTRVECADATINITDDSGNVLYSLSVPSSATDTQVIADSTVTITNDVGGVLHTVSVNAEGTSTQVISDSTVTNSDATYSASVNAEGSLSLPDITVTDSDGSTFSFPSAKNVTCTFVSPAPVGAKLMKTGQTTSYRTGDDGDIEAGRATNFTTLAANNPFGNTNRFTDELGGQTYTNNWVIDWSTYDGSAVLGYYRVLTSNKNWNEAVDECAANTFGTFTGCRLANLRELQNIMNTGVLPLWNYSPINLNLGGSDRVWTSNTVHNNSTLAYHVTYLGSAFQAKTTKSVNDSYIPCRNFTVSGTILS